MRAQLVEQLHETPAHHPCRLHVPRQRILGLAGKPLATKWNTCRNLKFQDGTFSYSDFAEAFQEIEVQRVIHAYENGISIDLHCAPEGDWTRLPKESFAKACKVRRVSLIVKMIITLEVLVISRRFSVAFRHLWCIKMVLEVSDKLKQFCKNLKRL